MNKQTNKQQKWHISIEEYTKTQNPIESYDYVNFAHISRRLMEVKWEESAKEIKTMSAKMKHSYRYDQVKRGGNSLVMKAWKSIAARFYQLK